MLTKLDRLKGYSARETCVALLSMLAILLFASAIAIAQTSIVVSQQFWGANETNSACHLRDRHGRHGRRQLGPRLSRRPFRSRQFPRRLRSRHLLRRLRRAIYKPKRGDDSHWRKRHRPRRHGHR